MQTKSVFPHHILLFIVALLSCGNASAQQYPHQPVRFIVPAPAGGGGDIIARLIAQKLTGIWGQQVIVDNRGGANNIIGTDLAAKSKPDGYTFVEVIASYTINPALYPNLPYKSADFAPVTVMAEYAYVLTIHPSVPAKTVKDLIALAKAKPGALSYASSGNGSGPHLTFELFKSMAGGINIVHVPYKGAGAANTDLVSGQVQMFLNNFLAAKPLIQAGKLRVLAVTSAKRSSVAPEIPTVAESGLPGFEVTSWFGILVPAGTPEAIITKLQSDIATVLRMPDLSSKLAADGADPVGNTPAQFAQLLQADTQKWAKLIKDTHLHVD